jgi:hypothetical protein
VSGAAQGDGFVGVLKKQHPKQVSAYGPAGTAENLPELKTPAQPTTELFWNMKDSLRVHMKGEKT